MPHKTLKIRKQTSEKSGQKSHKFYWRGFWKIWTIQRGAIIKVLDSLQVTWGHSVDGVSKGNGHSLNKRLLCILLEMEPVLHAVRLSAATQAWESASVQILTDNF